MFSAKKHAKALPLQLAVDILQIPVSVVFGYFIDLTMYLLFWVEPQGYAVKLVALVAGCIVLGFGVYLEVLADVVMLPGESFVRAVVQVWHTNFGTTKIIFDSSMTVIAAVLTGFCVRFFSRWTRHLTPFFHCRKLIRH